MNSSYLNCQWFACSTHNELLFYVIESSEKAFNGFGKYRKSKTGCSEIDKMMNTY